jgi:putative hydrolase of the HAD superfamily
MTRAEEARQRLLEERFPRIAARWGWRAFREKVMGELARTRPEIAHSPSDLQKAALRICAVEESYDPTAVSEEGFGAFAAARLRPTLYPGALEMIQVLRSMGKIIGTLTNGNAEVPGIAGLRDLVDFSLTAEAVGAAKPDRAMFEAAMRVAGITDPSQCVHVGDDHGKDVIGAKSAGWRTIWCPKGQAWETSGPVAVTIP